MAIQIVQFVALILPQNPLSLLSLSWDEEDNKDEDYEKAIISPPKPLSPSP